MTAKFHRIYLPGKAAIMKPAAVKVQLVVLIIDKIAAPDNGKIKIGPDKNTIFELHLLEKARLFSLIFCQLASFKAAAIKVEVGKPAIDKNGVFKNSIFKPAIIKTAVFPCDIDYFSRGEIVVFKFSLPDPPFLEFSRHYVQ
jgi:hypothetical protein